MKQIFEKYLGGDTLLEIYFRDDSNFNVGGVLAVDDAFVLLYLVSKYGRDEGLLLCSLESIVSVQADTRYLKKTRRLSERYPQRQQFPEVEDDNLLKSLIGYAQKNGLGVSFELKSESPEDYCGVILDCGDDVVTLRQVGLFGEDDGIAYVRLDEIGRVDCDDQDMNARLFCAQKK